MNTLVFCFNRIEPNLSVKSRNPKINAKLVHKIDQGTNEGLRSTLNG